MIRLTIPAIALLASALHAQITPFSVDATTGFTGWTIDHTTSNTSQAGNFHSGVPTGAFQDGSQILTAGNTSWALYANSGQTASAFYGFGDVLPVGGTVTISMDNGWVDTSSTVGIRLENSAGVTRFQFSFLGGGTGYQISDSVALRDVSPSVGFDTAGFSITFTQLASNNYSLTVGATDVTNESTLEVSDISRIRIFNNNAGSGDARNAYFNNLTVVPEPSSFALLASLAGLGFAASRRRRS